ncbi:unnamed protein product, partial [Phaeothamnion confervicola]
DGAGPLAPTNSILQSTRGGFAASPTNKIGTDPQVVGTYDASVDFVAWRNNANFFGSILVASELPPNLLGDYHLASNASPAYNAGAASKAGGINAPTTVPAPTTDFDAEPRPAFGAFDIGADELSPAIANLAVTNTDGRTVVSSGQTISYTIVVTNLGPAGVANAPVTDNAARLASVTWTCIASSGSSCAAPSGTAPVATTVSLSRAGTATLTVTGTVQPPNSGTVVNTATVSAPAGTTDPNTANNTATDTDNVVPSANLGITKSDGITTATLGTVVHYTVVASNAGPLA